MRTGTSIRLRQKCWSARKTSSSDWSALTSRHRIQSCWPTVWETSYQISIDTMLPGSVLEAIATFEAANPQKKFFALSIVERWDGNFYGLSFGNVLDYTTIFVKFE